MKTRIVLTLIAASLAGCGGGSDEQTVVAAFYPLAFAAEQIGGDGLAVHNMTPPGVEPHDLELSGRDVRTIADARTVFYLGDGFQPALEDAIESASAHAVDLLGAVKTRPGGEEGAPTRTSGSIRSATRRSRSGSATSSTRGRRPSASPRGCARSTRSSAAASRAASARRS